MSELKLNKEINNFLQLYKDQEFNYELKIDEHAYHLFDVIIFKNIEPVSRPTLRGGVYSSDTTSYKMNAKISDVSIIPLLTKCMLGPNTEFKELKITATTNINYILKSFVFILNLTNSVQRTSTLEISMTILRINSSWNKI